MPRLRSVCLAGGALVVVVAAGSSPEPWSQAPAPAARVAAAAPDPEGSQAIAPPGRVLPVPTSDGRIVDIAVLGVRLRRGNHRLIDVRLRYALRRGASYRMDPAREAQLVDGSDQLLTAMRASELRPALEPALLRRGIRRRAG